MNDYRSGRGATFSRALESTAFQAVVVQKLRFEMMVFKLVPTTRGGSTNSPLIFTKYSSLDAARHGAKQLIHENGRVIRVMIVEEPSRFVEWVERAG